MHDPNSPPANPRDVGNRQDGGLPSMADTDIVRRIDELVAEEHRLERDHASEDGLSASERARLDDLEVQLDQAWDLLRQRRARRDAGQDPSAAHTRDSAVVEHYQQ